MVRESMGGFERVQLETELSNLLGKDIDLVVFGSASPLLRHQILKYGLIVYEADPMERVRQETIARKEYLDSLALYRIPGEDKSQVDKELVSRKLSRLRTYADELRRAKDINWDKYRSDLRARAFVERYIHLAIEDVIDVANHFVSFYQWREPTSFDRLVD